MYFYRKNSKEKIIHKKDCHYVNNSSNFGMFKTLEEAHQNGYRLCRHCNASQKMTTTEKREINTFCEMHNFLVCFKIDHIFLFSLCDKWIIPYTEKGSAIKVYHKSKTDIIGENSYDYAGYHCQNVLCESIVDALEYIYIHDKYRVEHPFRFNLNGKEIEPPQKGTKRYAKAQKQTKKAKKKKAVWNVLMLINSLSATAQVV